MKMPIFAWPEGLSGACTTSWDDGTVHDRRLVAILDKYGLKGTFNLNSSKFGLTSEQSGWKPYIGETEVTELFKRHEIAAHGVNHPFLWKSPDAVILSEIYEDRRALEQIAGYPVIGMALPYGGPNDPRVRKALRNAGIVYARSVASTHGYELPVDFMYWTPTCHCFDDLLKLWDAFVKNTTCDKLFYLWGHSYEFDDRKDWAGIEAFAEKAAKTKSVWHATNYGIYEYVKAWQSLVCAADMSSIRNISGVDVFLKVDNVLIKIDPGKTVRL